MISLFRYHSSYNLLNLNIFKNSVRNVRNVRTYKYLDFKYKIKDLLSSIFSQISHFSQAKNTFSHFSLISRTHAIFSQCSFNPKLINL